MKLGMLLLCCSFLLSLPALIYRVITRISDLKKSSTKWRIAVRVTHKTELLTWNTVNSRGNFFTVDFIDSEVRAFSLIITCQLTLCREVEFMP
jgi:hypothetical protein